MNALIRNSLVIDTGIAKVFDHIDDGGPMWAGNGKRWARSKVRFGERFNTPPKVQLAIAMIDADSGHNLRLELIAEDITAGGFTVVAHTWSDTRIGRLQVSWTAFGTVEAELPGAWEL